MTIFQSFALTKAGSIGNVVCYYNSLTFISSKSAALRSISVSIRLITQHVPFRQVCVYRANVLLPDREFNNLFTVVQLSLAHFLWNYHLPCNFCFNYCFQRPHYSIQGVRFSLVTCGPWGEWDFLCYILFSNKAHIAPSRL